MPGMMNIGCAQIQIVKKSIGKDHISRIFVLLKNSCKHVKASLVEILSIF